MRYLLCTISLSLLMLVGCGGGSPEHKSENEASNGGEKKSVCGRIGRLALRLPVTDAFTGAIFEGSDPWKGETARTGHDCGDRLQEASIALTWPEMSPTGASPGLPRVGGKETITLTFMSYVPESGRDQGLRHEVVRSIDFSKPNIAFELVAATKRLDPQLGLYCAQGRSSVAFRELCWNEGADTEISTVVVCNRRPKVDPQLCRQVLLRPGDQVRVEIRYEGVLRPKWSLIERRASEFLEDHLTSRGIEG